MKKIIIFLALVTLLGCAKKTPMPETPVQATQYWQNYLKTEDDKTSYPFRIQLSLRFGEEGDTRRVTGVLWGNDHKSLRLDVMAGVGAVVANIYEDSEKFLMYLPRENKAFEHTGAGRPLLKIGVPLPFDLMQLASLLIGSYPGAFGNSFLQTRKDSDEFIAFLLDGEATGWLALNSRGDPQSWTQTGDKWKMAISYDENSTPLPDNLKLTHGNGKMAVLLVKGREAPTQKFPEMNLKLPPGVSPQPLSKYKPS